MIHHEAWSREAESLETSLQSLVERAKRGLIEPEEFMKHVVRLLDKGSTSNLLRVEGGYYNSTPQWVEATQGLVGEILVLREDFRKALAHYREVIYQEEPYDVDPLAPDSASWDDLEGLENEIASSAGISPEKVGMYYDFLVSSPQQIRDRIQKTPMEFVRSSWHYASVQDFPTEDSYIKHLKDTVGEMRSLVGVLGNWK